MSDFNRLKELVSNCKHAKDNALNIGLLNTLAQERLDKLRIYRCKLRESKAYDRRSIAEIETDGNHELMMARPGLIEAALTDAKAQLQRNSSVAHLLELTKRLKEKQLKHSNSNAGW